MSGQSPYMSAAQYGYPSSFQQRDVRYPNSSTVETAMGINRRPSLLAGYHNHFSSPERTSIHPSYLFSLAAPVAMGPHVDEHSKRSRYPTSLPLSVEVKKEQPLYQPQTEAISPIFDETKIDAHMRDTSTIRNSISKLESEIEIAKKKLDRAKLSQSEIKSQADRSAADAEENDDRDTLLKANGSQTLIEKILHDNRKKAEDSQKVLNQLNNNMDLTIPLYQEPNDLGSMEKIRTQYMSVMKNHLITLLKRSRENYMHRTKGESENYDQAYQDWQKSIEKEEKLILGKDAAVYRETFEKTFTELRKAREDKEKKVSSQNLNDSSSSSEQQQQLSSSINSIDQENEERTDEKMRRSSVIPPIMYDSWQRKHQYFNENGLIKGDATLFYNEFRKLPYWSSEEKQIFIDKFTQAPKNFGYISSFLENKTTEQCVQFYYMTKKRENYKNLLRKQTQSGKRKAKTATAVDAPLTGKVSSNTIISSTSQHMLGSGQDVDRSSDRLDNDEERRDIAAGDTNEDKRLNKNRCQLLSCTTEKFGKKKKNKNRLRAFPNKWNELSNENREDIRRTLQIPPNVQRCCTRCYEKLISEIRKLDEEDDDNDEPTMTNRPNSKQDQDEWTATEIEAFRRAVNKFNNDWTQIAEYVHRTEESCQAFYLKQYKNVSPIDNIDEDNGSISGSEVGQTKSATSERNQLKPINEDSNDSTRGMVIDEVEEQISIVEEKPAKANTLQAHLTTITSLVEKEISKTLSERERRSLQNSTNKSPERPINNNITSHSSNVPISNSASTVLAQPPPLVAVKNSQSPAASYQYPSNSQQQSVNKGSIMRGTPIASSAPTNKPMAVDIPSPHSYPHPYSNTRNEYSHLKSPKMLDRNMEQQQQLQMQQQHAAHMRHYPHSQQYLPSQAHINSSNKLDSSNADTFETLKADYATSKYLTSTHSPSHERQHRTVNDPVSSSQMSSSIGQQLLPPPAAIAPPTSNPNVHQSSHPHHSQQVAMLAASQYLASQGTYPPELLPSGLLPYASYYGASANNSPYLFDPRFMPDYATATANSEQLKAEHHKAAIRLGRHHPLPSALHGHSPPDSLYSNASTKRSSHDLGYPTNDYPLSMWQAHSLNSAQQMHPHVKHSSSSVDNPLLKLNELSRSSTRPVERNSRSPDDCHHHMGQSRNSVDSSSVPFQRGEALSHQKSAHDKSNPNLRYADHATDGNSLNFMLHPHGVLKPQATHMSPLRYPYPPNSNSRPLIPPITSSPMSPHLPYPSPGHSHAPMNPGHARKTEQPQQKLPHQSYIASSYPPQTIPDHVDSQKSNKTSISIQAFMNESIDDFVNSKNNDKTSSSELTSYESLNNQQARPPSTSNSDKSIFIVGDDDSNPNDQPDIKSTAENEMSQRGRVSSIKKILSNQPLEKPEYVEINQKVQSTNANAAKIHSNNDQMSIERSNTSGERTRSRGSITMRMLMGASDIYADGKAQPIPTNESQSNKRPASPHADKCEKIEYLIRDELDRECPPLPKREEALTIFQKSSSSNQQPSPQNTPKRLRPSPIDEDQRHSSHEATSSARDPFALQPQSKSQHSQMPSAAQTDKNWQSYVQQQQQQQYHLSNPYTSQFATRSSRPTGSITQGSPISSSLRLLPDQQQYSSAANNQLVNPRYSYYASKNEQQPSPPGHLSASSLDNSPKARLVRRANQAYSSSSDIHHESTQSTSGDRSSRPKSPHQNPISTDTNTSNTPPMNSSPPSTTSSLPSASTHSRKKRLINEYELEQQRNSPVMSSTVPTSTERIEAAEASVNSSKNDTDNVSNAGVANTTVTKPTEET